MWAAKAEASIPFLGEPKRLPDPAPLVTSSTDIGRNIEGLCTGQGNELFSTAKLGKAKQGQPETTTKKI